MWASQEITHPSIAPASRVLSVPKAVSNLRSSYSSQVLTAPRAVELRRDLTYKPVVDMLHPMVRGAIQTKFSHYYLSKLALATKMIIFYFF